MNLFIIIQTVKRSADELILVDPYGLGLTIISVTIVFLVLISLYLVFKSIGVVFHKINGKQLLKNNEILVSKSENEISGEVCSAIAMALYCYHNQMHDEENTILTIKKKNNEYSPWSSKIYGLRKTSK